MEIFETLTSLCYCMNTDEHWTSKVLNQKDKHTFNISAYSKKGFEQANKLITIIYIALVLI